MLIDHQGQKFKAPDFLIVGAAKSGTTSLHNYLNSHPDIFLPKCKESWFFTYKDDHPGFKTPDALKVFSKWEDYVSLFKRARQDQILGETSSSYLYKPELTIKNIKKIYGDRFRDLKIIVILRDPADRTWSNYMHLRRDMQEPLDFEETIELATINKRLESGYSILYDYIGLSLYHDGLKEYLSEFPLTKIFFFQDLRDTPWDLLREMEDFLEVDNRSRVSSVYNPGGEFNNKSKILSSWYKWYSRPDNKARQVTGRILPSSWKNYIDSRIRGFFLKKKRLPNKIREKLIKDYFYADIEKLKKLLPEQKEKIDQWLKF